MRECDTDALVRIRKFIREVANEQNKRAQDAQKRAYDRNHSKTNLKVGQFVWVREHTCPTDVSRKFHPKWHGPCVIVSLIGDRNNPRAVSILDFQAQCSKVVAIQDVKRHYERPEYLLRKLTESQSKKDDMQPDGGTEIVYDDALDYFDEAPRTTDKTCSSCDNPEHDTQNQPAHVVDDHSIAENPQEYDPDKTTLQRSRMSNACENDVMHSDVEPQGA